MNQPKQKPPRVVTKSRLLTSDEHVQTYDEKVLKKGKQKKLNKKGRMNESRGKLQKKSRKKQGSGVRTRGGIRSEVAAFEFVVERKSGSTYHLKNQLQKKK